MQRFKVKRIYLPKEEDDGYRVLVDRMWPRGIRKDAAGLDEWLKEISPSKELCVWFKHIPERYEEFAERYQNELQDTKHQELLEKLRSIACDQPVTLLYAAKDETHNNARVLWSILESTT